MQNLVVSTENVRSGWIWETLGDEIYNLTMADARNQRRSSVSRIFLLYGLHNWWFSGVTPQDRGHWRVNIPGGGIKEDSNFKFGHGDF